MATATSASTFGIFAPQGVTLGDNSVDGTKIAIGSDAQGDILYYDGADYTRLAAGTSGQYLKTQGGAANPAWNTFTNRFELVEENNISSAVQAYDFTGLDGDTEGTYILEIRVVNDNGGTASYAIRLNQANWAGRRQYHNASNTSVAAGRDTTIYLYSAVANGTTTIIQHFPAMKSGEVRQSIGRGANDAGASMASMTNTFDITTPSTATNITAIGIGANVASGIGVGSVLRLWKKV